MARPKSPILTVISEERKRLPSLMSLKNPVVGEELEPGSDLGEVVPRLSLSDGDPRDGNLPPRP